MSGKYSIDYYRKRVYTVEVEGDVREVILLKQTFKPVPQKKPDKKAHEVAPEQVPQAPSEEAPDKILAEFGENVGKLEISAGMEVGVIRSRL